MELSKYNREKLKIYNTLKIIYNTLLYFIIYIKDNIEHFILLVLIPSGFCFSMGAGGNHPCGEQTPLEGREHLLYLTWGPWWGVWIRQQMSLALNCYLYMIINQPSLLHIPKRPALHRSSHISATGIMESWDRVHEEGLINSLHSKNLLFSGHFLSSCQAVLMLAARIKWSFKLSVFKKHFLSPWTKCNQFPKGLYKKLTTAVNFKWPFEFCMLLFLKMGASMGFFSAKLSSEQIYNRSLNFDATVFILW